MAAVLGALDDKIELNRRMNALLAAGERGAVRIGDSISDC